MPVASLEKLAFGATTIALFTMHRTSSKVLMFGLIDLVLAALFLAAFFMTRSTQARRA